LVLIVEKFDPYKSVFVKQQALINEPMKKVFWQSAPEKFTP